MFSKIHFGMFSKIVRCPWFSFLLLDLERFRQPKHDTFFIYVLPSRRWASGGSILSNCAQNRGGSGPPPQYRGDQSLFDGVLACDRSRSGSGAGVMHFLSILSLLLHYVFFSCLDAVVAITSQQRRPQHGKAKPRLRAYQRNLIYVDGGCGCDGQK